VSSLSCREGEGGGGGRRVGGRKGKGWREGGREEGSIFRQETPLYN